MHRTIFLYISILFFIFLQNETQINAQIITEIHPNPIGTDTGKEWIKLFNPFDHEVDLTGFKIKTKSKDHPLENLIMPPKSIKIIHLKLANQNEKVSLINDKGAIKSEIGFDNAKEGKSLSLVKISDGQLVSSLWTWTTPNKASAPPVFTEIKGKISKEPQINKDFEFFINNKKIKIDETIFDFKLAEQLLKEGLFVTTLVDKDNVLQDFHIHSTEIPATSTRNTTQHPKWTHLLLIPISSIIAILIGLKRKKSPMENDKIAT